MLIVATVTALWLGLTAYRIELAFDCVRWLAEHWPYRLATTPVKLANAAIEDPSRTWAGIGAAFLFMMGWSGLCAGGRISYGPTPRSPMK